MINVNDFSSNNAAAALLSNTAAAQQQPPLPRTETAPDTERPVAPTENSSRLGEPNTLNISPQAQALSDANREGTEPPQADQGRNDDNSRQPQTPGASAAAQYSSVEKLIGNA